ncbi:MAG: polyprenyl synthetase family protein [Thermoguttaceae bacterium]
MSQKSQYTLNESIISSHLSKLQCEIEAELDRSTQFNSDCPRRLQEAIRYSLLAPGKRLRPLFVLLASELCGGNTQKSLSAAAAVEMIHSYSLIHDDLPAMDNDDLRRGLPTCHRKFDEATAILAGDALLTLAFETLGKITPIELAGRCSLELSRAAGACQLIGGQMDDIAKEKELEKGTELKTIKIVDANYVTKNHSIAATSDAATSEFFSEKEFMERIHSRKTGALIRVSLRLGGLIADASDSQIQALDDFGKYFGLAFQISDDILDVVGDEKTVGKKVQKDAALDKWSYPRLIGIDAAKNELTKTIKLAEESLSQILDSIDVFETSSQERKKITSCHISHEVFCSITRGLATRKK